MKINGLFFCLPFLFVAEIFCQTVKDFTLTDMKGKKYNCYTLLGQNKHIIVHYGLSR